MAVCGMVAYKWVPKSLLPILHSLVRHHTKGTIYETTNNIQQQTTYTVLYKWPTMKHFRIISRLKIFQAGIMSMAVPPLSYWYYAGHITGDSLILGCSAAVGTVLILCGLSYGFSRVLGELSYCQDTQTVRLSHLNFLGQRRNIEISILDIVPYTDTQLLHNYSISFVHRLETTNGVYYYSLKYGHIINREQLYKVLGLTS